MNEISEDEVLRFTRKIPVPRKGTWDVALLCKVEPGETVGFRGRHWTVETVSEGEFCGAHIYQARLRPEPVPQEAEPYPVKEPALQHQSLASGRDA